MSDLKKIKEEFLFKLKRNLSTSEINQIKSDLFGKNGLISSIFAPVKVLGNGSIDKAVNVTASSFSDSAAKKIEDAGGKATTL